MKYKDLNFYIADAIHPEKNSSAWIKNSLGNKSTNPTYGNAAGLIFSSSWTSTGTSATGPGLIGGLTNSGTSIYNSPKSFAAQYSPEYPLPALVQVSYEKYIQFQHIQSILPNTRGNGWITTTLAPDRMIPMLDVDHGVEACLEHLTDTCKIPFACFTSSTEDHCWIFLDKIQNFENGTKLVERMRYSDHNYIKCTQLRKQFVVRGHFKYNGVPQVKTIPTNASSEFLAWVNAFADFWVCDDMKNVLSNYVIEAL